MARTALTPVHEFATRCFAATERERLRVSNPFFAQVHRRDVLQGSNFGIATWSIDTQKVNGTDHFLFMVFNGNPGFSLAVGTYRICTAGTDERGDIWPALYAR